MKLRFVLVAVLCAVHIAFAQKTKTLVEAPDVSLQGKAYSAVHALLIGVNNYPNLPKSLQLSHAVDDATAFQKVLTEDYGFKDVTLLTDKQATLEGIRTALSSLADNTKIKPDDLVLIYFSGHGQTVPIATGGSMGFLIPSDAKVDLKNPTNSAPYLESCMPMQQIWQYLDLSPAKHALVIADACFSGLLARSRGLGVSSATMDVLLARRARQIMTAGSGGQETRESDALGHGVFTAKLLDELKARAAAKSRPFTISDLFATLQEQVADATNGKQTPQLGSFDSDGEVVFVPSGVAATPKAETVRTETPKIEPPHVEPPKTEVKKDAPKSEPAAPPAGKVPAGLSTRQGQYYLQLQAIFADGANHFENLPRKSGKTTIKPNGTADEKVYELIKPLPGFFYGGVTDALAPDAFLYFEGSPTDEDRVYEDYKTAIRALMPGGQEQRFSEINWRISNGTYQIWIRRELKDNWHPEKVYQNMTLTILKI